MMLFTKSHHSFLKGMVNNLWKIYEVQQKPVNYSSSVENNKGRIYSKF